MTLLAVGCYAPAVGPATGEDAGGSADRSFVAVHDQWISFPDGDGSGDLRAYCDKVIVQLFELSLMSFDLTALGPADRVTAARLRLYVTSTPASGMLFVYRILEGWVEGEATWLDRASGLPWTNAGASPPSSRSSEAIGQTMVADPGSWSLPLEASVVQGWIDDPSSNHGVVVAYECPDSTMGRVVWDDNRAEFPDHLPTLEIDL